MKTVSYVVKDSMGLHARPAGIMVKQAAGYKSKITIKNDVNGKEADAKRIMGIMALGVKQGNQVTLTIEGDDEAKRQQS